MLEFLFLVLFLFFILPLLATPKNKTEVKSDCPPHNWLEVVVQEDDNKRYILVCQNCLKTPGDVYNDTETRS